MKNKKSNYLKTLIASILVTGTALFPAQATEEVSAVSEKSEAVKSTKEDLAAKIAQQEEEIKQMLKEIEERQAQLKLNERDTLRMADWYSKPWYESDFLSVMLSYAYSDSVSKDWIGSRRSNTSEDRSRAVFSNDMFSNGVTGSRTSLENALDYSARMRTNGNFSSGWVNDTDAYNTNTNLYDYTDKIIILPVVKVPGLTRPDAPVVTVNMPDAPTKVAAPVASVPTINPIAVTIGEPQVTPPAMSPAPTVAAPTLDQIVVNDPGVTVSSPVVSVNPTEPQFDINVKTPSFNMTVKEVEDVPEVKIEPPEVTPNITQPNASPYSLFSFQNGDQVNKSSKDVSYDGANGNLWAGMDTTKTLVGGQGTAPVNDRKAAIIYINGQDGNSFTNTGFKLENINLYAAGYDSSSTTHQGPGGEIAVHTVWDGKIDNVNASLGGKATFISIETWHAGYLKLGKTTPVTVDIKNSDNSVFYIYPSSYSALLNTGMHAWGQRGGFDGKVDATITSQRNSVYVQAGVSGSFGIESEGTYELEGANNTIYSGLGYSANFQNLLKSVIATSVIEDKKNTGMTPFIKFTKSPKSYGDNNVIMFFNNRYDDPIMPGVYNVGINTEPERKHFVGIYQGEIDLSGNIGSNLDKVSSTSQTNDGNINNGLYMINETPLIPENTGKKYVEGNIGIYSKSGQRSGIVPSRDLGAASYAYFDNDHIHNLEIAYLGVDFGKYSKDGIMVVSEKGTVIDIGRKDKANASGLGRTAYKEISDGSVPSIPNHISQPINDYDESVYTGGTNIPLSSYNDSSNKAATGTIMAYSTGKWENVSVTANSLTTAMSSTTETALNNLPSEINIYVPVTTTSRYKEFKKLVLDGSGNYTYDSKGKIIYDLEKSYPIVYMADKSGKINVKTDTATPADTDAKGYGSIVAYAKDEGKIDITGNVTAVDAWADDSGTDPALNKTLLYLYTNIGAYANGTTGSTTVDVNGKVEVNGIGALSVGNGAVVNLKKDNNVINSGYKGGLVATDSGVVNFYGGNINHGYNTHTDFDLNGDSIVDEDYTYKNKVPFFADSNGKINFQGATTINMKKGLLFTGATTDYDGTGTTKKYNIMNNVTVQLRDKGVNLGIFKGVSFSYTDEAGYLNRIGDFVKLSSGSIHPNGYTYDSYLINGNIEVGPTVPPPVLTIHLHKPDAIIPASPPATDDYAFNNITMQNEKVTFNEGAAIESVDGTGLVMGSNETATDNTTTGYENKGTIDIQDTTGAVTPVAVYTSFGHIDNRHSGSIKVKDGVAMAGVNGSILTNAGTVTLDNATATKTSVGIAAFSRRIKDDGSGLPDTKETITVGSTTYDIGTDNSTISAAEKSIEIINSGTIAISGTDGDSIGIYAENNTNAAKAKATVDNTGTITVGDQGTGIMVTNTKGSNTDKGVTLKLTTTGGTDITTGKNSVAIYAKNSDVNFVGDYEVSVKDNSVGIYTIGDNANSTLTMPTANKFKFKYNSATGKGAGIYYDNDLGQDLKSPINVEIDNVGGTTEVIGAIVAKNNNQTGGSIENTGKLSVTATAVDGAYGIVSSDVDVVNNGTINMNGTTNGGTGIFATRANVNTKGDSINISGANAIGIYGVNKASTTPPLAALTTSKVITVAQGTNNMSVEKDNSIGVYVKDAGSGNLTLDNGSNIDLWAANTAMSTATIGLALENAPGTTLIVNTNDGDIQVNDYNIGIYLKDSSITNTGTLNVTTPPGGSKGGVGMFAEGTTGTATVAGSTVNVKASTSTTPADIPMGILVSGSGMTVDGGAGVTYYVDPDGTVAIGNYLDGANNTTTKDFNYNLTSKTSGTIGIGSYYTNGAYGDTGSVTVKSTSTQLDGIGNPVRPIGMYYGASSTQNNSDLTVASGSQEAIGMYGDGLTFTNNGIIDLNAQSIGAYFTNSDVTNNGDVTIASGVNKGYGLYFKGGTSTNNADVSVDGTGSIGIISTGAATVENAGTMVVTGTDTIGGYAEEGGTFKNTATITSGATSIGAFATDTGAGGGAGTVINEGTMDTDNVAMYANNGAIADQNSGNINVNTAAKTGIIVDGNNATANLNGGNIKSTQANVIGVRGDNTGIVNEAGTNITLSGDDSVGISLDNGSQATLTSGDITVGANGTGVSGNLSTINISNYAGTIKMGNKGMGIFAQDTPITATISTPLNINYAGADKGVGVYYTTPATAAPVTNNVTVNHTGINLVHIYNDGINMINAADQTVNDGGIAVYSDNSSTLDNQGNITLNGDDSVGIYLANNSTLTNIGNISGGLASTPTATKVGVYVKSGDVTGSAPYNFNIPGGIGIYLKGNVISYTGDVNVAAASSSDGLQRTIGVYVDPALSGNLATKIIVTGADAIGLYLASDTGAGTAANIVYDGTLDISANSTANRGLGAYLAENTTLTLGTSGIVNIAGQNNIGFYVSNGAILNVTGGTVNNTVDGIFAYLDNGYLHFTSGAPININYANIIVSGPAAQMINDTSINVGNGGLQGDNGATIINNGTINGTTADAKGMVGKATGTTLNNNGNIILTGDQSVAMYVEDGATANSTGNVAVSNKSVAYYAGKNGATKGTINVSGTTSIGENSSIMYANGGDINYLSGDITVGNKRTALTLEDAGSLVDFNNSNVIVDANGVGVYVTGTGVYDTGVVNMTDMIVNSNGTGIYLDNPAIAFNADQKIDLKGDGALGILAANAGNVDYTGTITGDAGAKEVKGIVAKVAPGTALNVKNSGTIDIKGDSGIGMYANGAALVENTAAGNIIIAKGVTGASAVGLYGDTTNVSNKGTVTVADNAVGMYGKDSNVENTGNLVNTIGHSTGIYGENSTVVNNENIAFGDMSNGAFVQDGILTNNANVTVGQGTKTAILGSNPTEYDMKASVGLYGGGTTSIYHNAGATITTGNYGVGIASENGYIETQNGSNFNMGEESVYIYADKGTGVNKTDLTLSDYSVGMYANHGGTLTNKATINVGKSSTVANDLKISVGMATGTNKTNKVTGDVDHIGGGTIVNEGTINVGQPNGVGMIANNNHIDAVDGNFYTGYAENKGIINVTGKDAYGMEASEGATIKNTASGEIYAVGQGARAMAATTGANVINDGYIEVIGTKAEGIYVDRDAKAYNNGTIVVNGTGKKGIYVGQGGLLENEGDIQLINGATEADKKDVSGSGTIVNIGKISIDSTGPIVMMGGVTINNVGTITVNGALDFNKVSIGGVNSEIGIGSINADTFEGGELIVLPDLTQGNNQTVRVVQYLNGAINVPNNGSLTAISQSVSWLADLQADPKTTNTYRVVLVKIPYQYLLDNTPAVELGNGMDEIYEGAKGTELEMFDAIDMISDKDELGATMDMELRGNLYANLQQRVLDINDAFDMAYENLKHDRLYSKDSLKIGAIVTGNKRKFKKADITNYESKTYGVMLLQEYDTRKYGETWNWNIGLAHTDFDFDRDSEEEVYSLNLGAAYERFVGSSYNWKWYTRGEISINHHDTDRKIHLSTGTYTNNAKFWSAKGFWNNKLRYEIPIDSKHIKAGVFGTMRLGYGKYDGFKETGDGIRLDLKGHDMYFVRPGIGADIAYTKYTNKGKIVLYGTATYEYELGKQYNGANKAKVRDTQAGYYDLEKPKDIKGGIKLSAGAKISSRCGHSIGAEVSRYEGAIDSTRVGVNVLFRIR